MSTVARVSTVERVHCEAIYLHVPQYDGEGSLLHAETGSHEELDVLVPNATQCRHLIKEAYQVFNFSHSPRPNLDVPVPVPTAHVHNRRLYHLTMFQGPQKRRE